MGADRRGGRYPSGLLTAVLAGIILVGRGSRGHAEDIKGLSPCRQAASGILNVDVLKTRLFDHVNRTEGGSPATRADVDDFFRTNNIIVHAGDLRPQHQDLTIYALGASLCGTGGCNAYVISQTNGRTAGEADLTFVGRFTLAQTPVVALRSAHHGWQDLGIMRSGGGAAGGLQRIVFDGQAYRPDRSPGAANAPRTQIATTLIDSPGEKSTASQCRLE